jgi:hypothetical protein
MDQQPTANMAAARTTSIREFSKATAEEETKRKGEKKREEERRREKKREGCQVRRAQENAYSPVSLLLVKPTQAPTLYAL